MTAYFKVEERVFGSGGRALRDYETGGAGG